MQTGAETTVAQHIEQYIEHIEQQIERTLEAVDN